MKEQGKKHGQNCAASKRQGDTNPMCGFQATPRHASLDLSLVTEWEGQVREQSTIPDLR